MDTWILLHSMGYDPLQTSVLKFKLSQVLCASMRLLCPFIMFMVSIPYILGQYGTPGFSFTFSALVLESVTSSSHHDSV